VTIDQGICTSCGKCITACSDFEFKLVNGKATLADYPVFGYPKINYTKGIQRTFANVDFL